MAGSPASPFDSIYAPATPTGIAERAVIRLSGAEVFAHLSRLLGRELPRNRVRVEADWPLLQVGLPIALQVFPGPASYTGEDLVELHLSSSPLILEAVMETLEHAGLRLAWPGEFTRRAFENGKLDLAEVEAVLALIHSRDEQDLARAAAVLAGDPGLSAGPYREELLDILALLEAGLDFEEGETGEVREELWRPRVEVLARELAEVEGNLGRTALDLALPGFVLLGPPNAGKTSLWNYLLEQELQQSVLVPGLVSEEAGTTRDLRWLRLPSLGLRLADSPGRELWMEPHEEPAPDSAQDLASDQASNQASEQAQEFRILRDALSQASGYLWLERMGPQWEGAPTGLGTAPVLSLATRADEVLPANRALPSAPSGSTESLPPEVQAISLQSPELLAELVTRLRQLPGASPMGEAFLGMLLGRLHKARDILQQALDPALVLPELVAEELRQALALLEPEQAQQVPEEILDRIFGRFCLGK